MKKLELFDVLSTYLLIKIITLERLKELSELKTREKLMDEKK